MRGVFSRKGLRFSGIYLAGIAASCALLGILIATRRPEYIDYVPLLLGAFALPWSLLVMLHDNVAMVAISFFGGIVLNAGLLYWLGRIVERRRPNAGRESVT
jgi:Na+-driven multidrug efflux pump